MSKKNSYDAEAAYKAAVAFSSSDIEEIEKGLKGLFRRENVSGKIQEVLMGLRFEEEEKEKSTDASSLVVEIHDPRSSQEIILEPEERKSTDADGLVVEKHAPRKMTLEEEEKTPQNNLKGSFFPLCNIPLVNLLKAKKTER